VYVAVWQLPLGVGLERATVQAEVVVVIPMPNRPVGAYTESTTNGNWPPPDPGTQIRLPSEVDDSRGSEASTVTSGPLSFVVTAPDVDPACEAPLVAPELGAATSWSASLLPLCSAVPPLCSGLPVVCGSPDRALPLDPTAPVTGVPELASGEYVISSIPANSSQPATSPAVGSENARRRLNPFTRFASLRAKARRR